VIALAGLLLRVPAEKYIPLSRSRPPQVSHGSYFKILNININQYSKTNQMHFLYSIYYELRASTCFEHYLLIFRGAVKTTIGILRECYICWLLPGLEFHSNPGSSHEQIVLETCRGPLKIVVVLWNHDNFQVTQEDPISSLMMAGYCRNM
jgi:hypothetical protein